MRVQYSEYSAELIKQCLTLFIIDTFFSDFSFDDTYMFVPIQFGFNVNTKTFCNIHPVYVHSINTNHIIFFISFVATFRDSLFT